MSIDYGRGLSSGTPLRAGDLYVATFKESLGLSSTPAQAFKGLQESLPNSGLAYVYTQDESGPGDEVLTIGVRVNYAVLPGRVLGALASALDEIPFGWRLSMIARASQGDAEQQAIDRAKQNEAEGEEPDWLDRLWGKVKSVLLWLLVALIVASIALYYFKK